MRLLSLAALASLLATSASAEIKTGFGWAQGSLGTNFATVEADLDTSTGVLSVWATYEGLEGDLLSVRVSDNAGSEWALLAHAGGREGFTSGNLVTDPARLAQLLTSGLLVRFHTTAFPTGEMSATLGFAEFYTIQFTTNGSQVVAGGAPGGSGNTRLGILADGRVNISGSLSGIDFPISALELRGPAWYGEEGPLMLDLGPFNQAGTPNGLDIRISAAQLTDAQRLDLRDGQCYFLVRTNAYPAGALRGQMYLTLRPQSYCSARRNSISTIGGRVTVTGSIHAADNDITLHGQFIPMGAPVLPLVGLGTVHTFHVPGSEGTLCIGGGWIGRYVNQVTQGQGLTLFDVPIDLLQVPSSAGTFSAGAGSRLNFQLWFRDNVNGIPVSNFSDAVSVRLR